MTALDVLTLVVAILGALTGVAALVWQAVTFALSGGRVKVALKTAWLGPGGAIIGEPGTWKPGQPPAAAYDTECFGVEVRNVGRLPVSVTGWGVKVGPAELGDVQNVWNKPLPHRLEVGEAVTWFVEARQVMSAADTIRPPELRAAASLGTGKRVVSKNRLAFAQEGPADSRRTTDKAGGEKPRSQPW